MAVMAEFLWRGWNVALPEVDVGDDIFVVKDETGELSRVQVKTATAKALQSGYSAQFNLSLKQLVTLRSPDLLYVFAIRSFRGWEPFILVNRYDLALEYENHGVGSVSRGDLILRFSVQNSELWCSNRDFQAYWNDWSSWPVLKH